MGSKLFLVVVVLMAAAWCSEIRGTKSMAVTIYNNQFAMVKDVREISFDQGISDLYFTDVSSNIQTETVTFKALNETENIRVFEQNYEANLVNKNAILKKYINQKLEIVAKYSDGNKRISGILLSYSNGFILQTPYGIEQVDITEGITFPSLPAGFYTLPTLKWKVYSVNQLTASCEVAYRTTGFSWKADYLVTINDDETRADIGGWVTIDNQSGKKYENTKLKLIAGDINTVTTPVPQPSFRTAMPSAMMFAAPAPAPPTFEEKSFSDYHMYTLSQVVTVDEQSKKQIEFIPKVYGVGVRKYHLISINSGGSGQANLKAANKIQFRNSKANKLGIPLPKGTVRVFKTDSSDGSLEFIGEDSINHTPKDENITLTTGNAFDITANKIVKRYVSYYTNTTSGYEADLNLTISNHKDISAEIVVDFSINSDSRFIVTWANLNVNVEKVSASLLRIKRLFGPSESVSYVWNEYIKI